MKFIILSLALLSLATNASADIKGAPYQPEIDQRFDVLEDAAGATSDAADGSFLTKKYARATYDVAVDGTSSSSAIGLGVYLPAKAIVTKVLFYTDTQFTDSGTGSLAVQCEDTANLLTSQDITGWAVGSVHNGVPVIATPTIVDSIAAQCQISVISDSCSGCILPDAGKMEIFVDYFIKN